MIDLFYDSNLVGGKNGRGGKGKRKEKVPELLVGLEPEPCR